MPKPSNRNRKIVDLLKKELALLIQSEIRDPRVGMVSVTGAKVSRDLSYAEIFVTILGKTSEEDIIESMKALNRASGFLRSLLAKGANLRTTPKLSFSYDNSLNRGRFLSDLIDEAIASDNKD
ncbi:MAG: ribosome-binding factor A [SAR86 cluster bacterium]|uniref:Ribosome-binding factor A n=1 Tax=SAR86 cluster bacterium TaxID=2030880 RepID=A0A2A5CG19_9GAMM|nr:MAG: ribosome-binding factor A [SAR86 cluster bacterium]